MTTTKVLENLSAAVRAVAEMAAAIEPAKPRTKKRKEAPQGQRLLFGEEATPAVVVPPQAPAEKPQAIEAKRVWQKRPRLSDADRMARLLADGPRTSAEVFQRLHFVYGERLDAAVSELLNRGVLRIETVRGRRGRTRRVFSLVPTVPTEAGTQ